MTQEIFISAGEASSDMHLAKVVELLQIKWGNKVHFYGLGGDKLEKQNVELLMHNRKFSVMGGPLEVIGKLPLRRKLERTLEKRLLQKNTIAAILVDNGEINLRLASLLKFLNIPVMYFIPPKVWVWRHSRIEKIKQHVDVVCTILPFEKEIYEAWEIHFEYVGNPLIDEMDLKLTRDDACKALGLDSKKQYVSVFPGSRFSELKYHVKLFSEALKLFSEKLNSSEIPEILIPVASSMELDFVKSLFHSESQIKNLKIHFIKQEKASHFCLRVSRAAIIKSGTSTLEAAVYDVPMVLSYDSSAISKWMFKYIARYRGFIGMVNLFLVQPASDALGFTKVKPTPVVPELILEKCKPELIANELYNIYIEGNARTQMLANLTKAKEMLYPPQKLGKSPIAAVSEVFFKLLKEKNVII